MIKREKYTIKKETGCWEWKGAKTTTGYGRLKVNNVAWMAHRYSLFLHQGSLGQDTVVMHMCDNPSCINPEHLKEGTQKENMADCKAKGRLGPRGCSTNEKPKRDPGAERRALVVSHHALGWSNAAIAKRFAMSPLWVASVIQDFYETN